MNKTKILENALGVFIGLMMILPIIFMGWRIIQESKQIDINASNTLVLKEGVDLNNTGIQEIVDYINKINQQNGQ